MLVIELFTLKFNNMCFTKVYKKITEGKIEKPKVAKKDIIVWKVVGADGRGCYKDLYITNEAGEKNREPWTRGFQYTETTPFYTAIAGYKSLEINGHAFHSKKVKHDAFLIQGSGEIIVNMVIPKGAKYYENDKEYVSSSIIFPLVLKDYL
jgi:hypothetical protein